MLKCELNEHGYSETDGCRFGGQELRPVCLSTEKNSVRGKAIGKKWFVRIGCSWGLQVGRQESAMPWELSALQFYNQGKSGEGKTSFVFLEWCHASIISSFTRLSRGVFLSLRCQARCINCLLFSSVQRACPSWLRSLGKMQGSCRHRVIVWGHVSCFLLHGFVAKRAYLVLKLRKPDFLSNH